MCGQRYVVRERRTGDCHLGGGFDRYAQADVALRAIAGPAVVTRIDRRGCGAATGHAHDEGVAQSALTGRELGLRSITGYDKAVEAAGYRAGGALRRPDNVRVAIRRASGNQRDARRGRIFVAGDVARVFEAVAAGQQFGHEALVGRRVRADISLPPRSAACGAGKNRPG